MSCGTVLTATAEMPIIIVHSTKYSV
jgi:hypothetical protein